MGKRFARGRSRNARSAQFVPIAPILRVPLLDLAWRGTQTKFMAHIYLTFDFGKDEEKAQQARHKLDSWKQAVKLDKKMQGKFDRTEDGAATVSAPVAEAKSDKKAAGQGDTGKGKGEPSPAKL